MLGGNKHIKQYTAEDILRYLNRQMLAEERHAMEKAALEDPLLAEAIEGYTDHPDQTLSAHIEDLKKRLQQKTRARVVPLRSTKIWWSAAAAILIILGTAFTWYWLTPTENNIAQQNKKEQKVEPLKEKQNSGEITDKATESIVKAVEEPKSDEQRIPPPPKSARSPSALPSATPEKATASPTPQHETENDTVLGDDLTVNAANQAAAARTLRTNKAEESKNEKSVSRAARTIPAPAAENSALTGGLQSHIIKGKITDNNNKPLPFVNIRINHTASGTYSDARGNFTLFSADTSLLVDIKSVGFQPQQVIVYAGTPGNNILLQPGSNALSEVVASGYGVHKKKAIASDGTVGEAPEAAPADGWGDYDIYLANNTRLPETAFNTSRGFVDLSFSVDQYGRLSDFKITHSTCPQCNKEAIRVVKEGPSWKLTEGGSAAQVKITIQF